MIKVQEARLILDPHQADQGPPYYEVQPPDCERCGKPVLISDKLEFKAYVCYCGYKIEVEYIN